MKIANMPFNVGGARLSSIADPRPPLPGVAKYTAPGDDPGPALAYDSTGGRIYRMDILAGQHSAITLVGSQGQAVETNNHFNAVPGSRDLWIDDAPNAPRRHIFFHGRRFPTPRLGPEDRSPSHTSLFEIGISPSKRTVLQVRVLDPTQFQHKRVVTKLYGRSLALNAERLLNPYRMESNALIADGTSFGDVVGRVILGDIEKNGDLDHLVVNAHGVLHPRKEKDRSKKDIKIELGLGITKENISEWDHLAGKVRYIWFQSCTVGSDFSFCGKVAMRTGALVIAYTTETAVVPPGLPDRTSDVLIKEIRIWDSATCVVLPTGEIPSKGPPNGPSAFWSEARYVTGPSLAQSLRFNMLYLIYAP